MFHSSRGAGCPCKYQPNEEACMRHWHHWRRPVTYLPFFFFFGFDLSVCHFTIRFWNQWLGHTAQGLSGVSCPDVIELTRKTNMLDGPMRTPYDIRPFKNHKSIWASWTDILSYKCVNRYAYVKYPRVWTLCVECVCEAISMQNHDGEEGCFSKSFPAHPKCPAGGEHQNLRFQRWLHQQEKAFTDRE